MGKVSDGEIRYGEGGKYPRLSQMLQDGWIFSMEMTILLTKQEFRFRV